MGKIWNAPSAIMRNAPKTGDKTDGQQGVCGNETAATESMAILPQQQQSKKTMTTLI